jgi:hypothetical protein
LLLLLLVLLLLLLLLLLHAPLVQLAQEVLKLTCHAG